MAKFSEHDVGLPGVDIAIKPVRSYVYGALASHLFGYVGAPDDTNREEAKMFTVLSGRRGGKIQRRESRWTNSCAASRACGVCAATPREQSMVSCAKNRRKQGANVYLTIDARIQTIAEEALRAVGRAARRRGRSE